MSIPTHLDRHVGLVTPARGRRPARSRRLTVILLVALGILVMAITRAPSAAAHAYLLRSDPASGATVSTSPKLVTLWFDEEVARELSTARVVRADGTFVDRTRPVTHPADPRTVQIALPPMATGSYGVMWSVVAADDGHSTSGTVVFGVGAIAATSAVADAPSGGAPLDVVRRWLGICALAGILGALAMIVLVLGRVRHGAVGAVGAVGGLTAANRRLLKLAVYAAAIGVAAAGWDVAANVQDDVAAEHAWPARLLSVLSTHWGGLWLVRFGALGFLVVAVLALLRGRPTSRGARKALLGLSCGLALTLVVVEALSSHAGALESARQAAILADVLHILTACTWLGCVTALAVLLWPATPDGVDRVAFLRTIRTPFSQLALGCVILLVVTGLYSAGRQVGAVDGLVSTTYGRALLVKSALLALLCGFGAANAHRLHDLRPRRVRVPMLSRRVVLAELAVGAAVLLVVGVLVEAAPARDQTHGAPVSEATRYGAIDDITVTISATPNRPGLNGFTVIAASSRRPAPGVVDAVSLELTGTATSKQQSLRLVDAGRFFGTVRLDANGVHQIRAVVDRGGERRTVTMPWSLDAAPADDSSPRLAPLANTLALTVVGTAAILFGLWIRRRRRDAPGSDLTAPPDDADGRVDPRRAPAGT